MALMNLKYWPNVFNILRLVDGLGFDYLYVVSKRLHGLKSKTARALTEGNLPWGRVKLEHPPTEGYNSVLFDIYEDAEDLETFVWPDNPLLVLGAEDWGVPSGLSGRRVRIPMKGNFRCINVACAAGIAMYDFVRKQAG